MQEPAKDLGYVDFSPVTRTLYVTGEIDQRMAHQIVVYVLDQDARDRATHNFLTYKDLQPIRVILNSDGGDADQGYVIYDALRSCVAKIIVEGYGRVQSIAAAIMQAGDVRRVSPSTMFMIHDGVCDAAALGDIAVEALLDHCAHQMERDAIYHKILASRSGKTVEEVVDLCHVETWYTPDEAVAAGFCDEVIQPTTGHGKWEPSK